MDEFGSDVVNLHDTQVGQMDVTNVRLRSTQEDTGMLKPEVVDRIHELSDEGLGSKRACKSFCVNAGGNDFCVRQFRARGGSRSSKMIAK